MFFLFSLINKIYQAKIFLITKDMMGCIKVPKHILTPHVFCISNNKATI